MAKWYNFTGNAYASFELDKLDLEAIANLMKISRPLGQKILRSISIEDLMSINIELLIIIIGITTIERRRFKLIELTILAWVIYYNFKPVDLVSIEMILTKANKTENFNFWKSDKCDPMRRYNRKMSIDRGTFILNE